MSARGWHEVAEDSGRVAVGSGAHRLGQDARGGSSSSFSKPRVSRPARGRGGVRGEVDSAVNPCERGTREGSRRWLPTCPRGACRTFTTTRTGRSWMSGDASAKVGRAPAGMASDIDVAGATRAASRTKSLIGPACRSARPTGPSRPTTSAWSSLAGALRRGGDGAAGARPGGPGRTGPTTRRPNYPPGGARAVSRKLVAHAPARANLGSPRDFVTPGASPPDPPPRAAKSRQARAPVTAAA